MNTNEKENPTSVVAKIKSWLKRISPKTMLIAFWSAFIVGLLIYNLLYHIGGFTIVGHAPCLSITRLGIYCATCGATRMTHHFLTFSFITSFFYNPIIFLVYLTFGIYMAIITAQIFLKKQVLTFPIYIPVAIFAVAIVAFTIVRNL
ncbi:MAG: DUF2752 domain-containing protein [Firmicutes bacterium]|nr:DUF2752 domain-containing protein [Bacillota bacterium]